MKKLVFISVIVILGVLVACENNENKDYPDDCLGCSEDIIHLSTKKADFDAQGDSIIVKTKGDWWWIDGIDWNGERYSCYDYYLPKTDFEEIRLVIEKDGYLVQKRDKHTLSIKVDKNTTGKERNLTVEVEAGDYFDRVEITQKAE